MKIILVCYSGMSTSVIMNKMRAYAEQEQIHLELKAVPLSEVEIYAEGADAVLLGPQVRYALADVRKKLGDGILVKAIDTRDFGRMRGEKILQDVLDDLK